MRALTRSLVVSASIVPLVGCGSGSVTTSSLAGPSPAKCQVSASSSETNFPASGGTGQLRVSTTRECGWTITGVPSWVHPVAREGQGESAVTYSVSPNPDPSVRRGSMDVNGALIEIQQAGAPPPAPPAPAPAPPAPAPGPAPGPPPPADPAPAPTPPPSPPPGDNTDGDGDEGDRSGSVEFNGPIGSISGVCPVLRITVDGRIVVTNAGTNFKKVGCADLGVGAKVKVRANRLPDGTYLASKIERD